MAENPYWSAAWRPIEQGLDTVEGWVEGLGVWGPLVYGLIYAACVVAMLPSWPLAMTAGAIFGPIVGTITASAGSQVGAALAFLISRYLARERLARYLKRYPRFHTVDRAIARGDWRVVALLRLAPAMPFNVQNYVFGMTGVRFWPCVLASWIAMLPKTTLHVYVGHVGRASLELAAEGEDRGPFWWIMAGVGLLAVVALAFYLTHLARQATVEVAFDRPNQ